MGIAVAVLSAVGTAVFTVLFVRGTDIVFLSTYGKFIEIAAAIVLAALAGLTVLFAALGKEFFYKTGLVCLVLLVFGAGGLYALSASGFLDRVDSVEDLREFIASYGGLSVFLFLAIQILQVVVLPVPGVVAIGAGVLLFGPFRGAILSLIGIMAGSFIAFFIGRKLGYKVVCWLVGKENLDKATELAKGKDKVILTFMFLFPFFPDDVLCFVSGLSSMSFGFFAAMITVARIISVFTTAYSVNGNLIPYDTWWGILIWAILIVGTFFLVKIVYSNSEKIEKFFKRQKK
ncbi:MAG: TVP38/TMEM64 family protein [Clostridia bacterium]|nr:TVP38/TMEM64 family protein [Clostridia bacterium]